MKSGKQFCTLYLYHNLGRFESLQQYFPALPGLPRSGKKFWKMNNFPGQGKVRELHFQSGKFKKMKKSQGKVREFQFFSKKMLVNRLLEI